MRSANCWQVQQFDHEGLVCQDASQDMQILTDIIDIDMCIDTHCSIRMAVILCGMRYLNVLVCLRPTARLEVPQQLSCHWSGHVQ